MGGKIVKEKSEEKRKNETPRRSRSRNSQKSRKSIRRRRRSRSRKKSRSRSKRNRSIRSKPYDPYGQGPAPEPSNEIINKRSQTSNIFNKNRGKQTSNSKLDLPKTLSGVETEENLVENRDVEESLGSILGSMVDVYEPANKDYKTISELPEKPKTIKDESTKEYEMNQENNYKQKEVEKCKEIVDTSPNNLKVDSKCSTKEFPKKENISNEMKIERSIKSIDKSFSMKLKLVSQNLLKEFTKIKNNCDVKTRKNDLSNNIYPRSLEVDHINLTEESEKSTEKDNSNFKLSDTPLPVNLEVYNKILIKETTEKRNDVKISVEPTVTTQVLMKDLIKKVKPIVKAKVRKKVDTNSKRPTPTKLNANEKKSTKEINNKVKETASKGKYSKIISSKPKNTNNSKDDAKSKIKDSNKKEQLIIKKKIDVKGDSKQITKIKVKKIKENDSKFFARITSSSKLKMNSPKEKNK